MGIIPGDPMFQWVPWWVTYVWWLAAILLIVGVAMIVWSLVTE